MELSKIKIWIGKTFDQVLFKYIDMTFKYIKIDIQE